MQFVDEGALIHGHVSARVFLGNHWLFQVSTALGPIQVTQVNSGLPSIAEGDLVGLTWISEDVRVVPRGN